MAKLLLIRGLPGSGKTTLARSMLGYTHIEADMYFLRDSKYVFQAKDVPAAHAWCLSQARSILETGQDVVVSNTFVCLWEMALYKNLGYPYEVKTAIGSFQNTHGVSPELIERMRARWQDECVAA